MEAADLLCDSLFHWLGNRKGCAEKLLELAKELEDVHQGSNIAQVVGAATSVASISGALLVIVLTGGLTSPLLLAAAAGTVTGTAVSVTSVLVEAGMSRSTFNKALELIKEDEKVGVNIQKLLRELKDRCGGTQADELDCEVTTQLMWALARRNNTHVPVDFIRGFNRATFFRHITPGGLAPDQASHFICQALRLVSSPVITSSLKVSAKEMVKDIGSIGIKAAVKAGSQVLGVISLGMSLYDLIVTTEELAKGDQVTKASKFLRDSAREGQQKLKEQLDAVHEIIQKLLRMKNLLKDLGGYSLTLTEVGQNIMAYIMGTCTDNTVISWIQIFTHQIEFVNLLRFFLERLGPILEDSFEPGGGHIHIVFVAHGRIVDHFMPSGALVPTPNIRDTILYSPWNCAIDSNAAFAIAQWNIEVTNREFVSLSHDMSYCEPNPLPQRWNSMRRSLHNIPAIHLSPVTHVEEAWAFFHKFWMNRSMKIEDRVIIPYLVPQNMVNAFREIPLFIFIFVTSFILMFYGKTATVHLAACLGRDGSTPRSVEWRTQYAYTSDGTWMTVNIDNSEMNPELLRAFRSLFDRNRR